MALKKPKLGAFAKRVADKRKNKSEAQKLADMRFMTNRVPTMAEARKNAGQLKSVPKPIPVMLTPIITVRQPAPYKAAAYRK